MNEKIKQLIDYHDDVPNIDYVDQITAVLNKPQSIKGKIERERYLKNGFSHFVRFEFMKMT